MQYLDIDCTLFSLCSAMETCGCIVRDVITAVWWKESTLVAPGCIWKRKILPKSLSETHICSGNSATMILCKELSAPLTTTGDCLPYKLFVVYKITLFYLIQLYCFSCIYVSFTKIWLWVASWNPHCRWKNSPYAVSVQQCEQRTVAVTVQLQLYFRSVRNLSVYTLCNSSACWCAGRI